MFAIGCKSLRIIRKQWDDEDIFVEDTNNQNLLAWFGFEETVRNIGYELGMEI